MSPKKQYSFQFSLIALVVTIISLLGAINITLFYLTSSQVIIEHTKNSMNITLDKTRERISNDLNSGSELIDQIDLLFQSSFATKATPPEKIHAFLERAVKTRNPLKKVCWVDDRKEAFLISKTEEGSITKSYLKTPLKDLNWYENSRQQVGSIVWNTFYFSPEKRDLSISLSKSFKNTPFSISIEIKIDDLQKKLDPSSFPYKIFFSDTLNMSGNISSLPDENTNDFLEEHHIPVIQKTFNKFLNTHTEFQKFKENGYFYLSAFTNLRLEQNTHLYLGIFTLEKSILKQILKVRVRVFLIIIFILLIALFLTTYFCKKISHQIRIASNQSIEVSKFILDSPIENHSRIKEISQLNIAIQQMKDGLKKFSKYLPVNVVRQLFESGESAKIGGQMKEITLFFSDLENFSAVSEKLSPEELSAYLNEYFNITLCSIDENRGTVDKLIGDAVMAFWGAPLENPIHAKDACQTALDIQKRLAEVKDKWKEKGYPFCKTRIGINSGEVIVGNIGSNNRMNYTVIGDDVNLASRLEGVNKFYDTSILITEATYNLVKEDFLTRPIDLIKVKGKEKSTLVYELVDSISALTPQETLVYYKDCRKAFDLYLKQEWKEAKELFLSLGKRMEKDPLPILYISRCESLINNPPSEWTGITSLGSK